MRTLDFGQPVKGLCPTDSVGNNALNLRNKEGGVAFMAWLEIENSAETLIPAAAGTENLSALEPTEEYKLIGSGNVETLAVHFLFGNFKIMAYALCNGV